MRMCLPMALAAIQLLSMSASGCAAKADDTAQQHLVAAYNLGQEYAWDEARAYVKAYLRVYPGDASAHFLLGQSYLRLPEPILSMAEGEILTAKRLYTESGEIGGLSGIMAPEEFEFNLHLEAARTYVRAFREALVRGMPVSTNLNLLEEAQVYVDQGLFLQPDHKYLREMREMLRSYLGDPPPGGVTI